MRDDILEYIRNSIKDAPIVNVPIENLKVAVYNPRTATSEQKEQVKTSISRFGMVSPILVNSAPEREQIIIGGHLRVAMAKELGIIEVPVRYINIPDINLEKELNLRLNKNTGDFDYDLLASWDESFLSDVGFSSEDLDDIFPPEENPEIFDIQAELEKLGIAGVTMQKGEIWQLGDSRLMIGDSTIEEDIYKLMNGEKADLCLCDPPYILEYLQGKQRHGTATEGFGLKRDRRYLETESLPDNFTELWMNNVAKVQKPDFSIMVFENPKNLRIIWNELDKHWKYRNTITWHLPNRTQGFAAKYKFFNKADIAVVGTGGEIALNLEPEVEELFQQEYQNALYATSGKPHWEQYEKGKKICPTDFIEFVASDEKNSGQGIIYGTKPIEILLPYVKVLTHRGDLIIEPFGGAGSTLIAAEKLKRRCYIMEKVPTYAEVIRNRWERLTGLKAVRISG